MKRIAFLVFIFATVIIAQEENIKKWAEFFQIEEESIKLCVAGITEEEFEIITRVLDEDDNFDNKSEEISMKYRAFLTCIAEQLGMIKDSKLVVDKIIEYMDISMSAKSEEIVRECFNKLNDKSEMDVTDRMLGMLDCVSDEDENMVTTMEK